MSDQHTAETNLVERYRQALEDILNPVGAMKRDLPNGYKLDGHAAVRAGANPETYKDIARKALERPATPPEGSQGYVDAFYEIAKVLGIPAMPVSPKEGFETVMLPRLRQLLAAEAVPPVVPSAVYERGREHYRKHGHGHVVKRDDGAKARCGGPCLCKHCQIEQAAIGAHETGGSHGEG